MTKNYCLPCMAEKLEQPISIDDLKPAKPGTKCDNRNNKQYVDCAQYALYEAPN